MKITDIRIFPVGGAKLKAFVSIIFDNCFIISDIKVIEGNKGLFLSMPSKKRKNGTFKDIAHPLNSEMRTYIEDNVIDKFNEVMEETDASELMTPSEAEAEDPVFEGMEEMPTVEEIAPSPSPAMESSSTTEPTSSALEPPSTTEPIF